MTMELQRPPDNSELTDDKITVLEEYHDGTGQVCIDAGAGTGKTTTLIEVVAEAVLRELAEHPDENPFDVMLVTTFTKDAAGELKTELKERLRDHERAADEPLDSRVWRWIETESHIGTIDSFVNDLLREIAAEAGVAPSFEIVEGIDREDLLEELMAEVEAEHPGRWERLTAAYPEADYLEYPPDTVPEMLSNAHQKAREFCWSADDAAAALLDSVDDGMYAGHAPFETLDDINAIISERVDPNAAVTTTETDQLLKHVQRSHEHSRQLAEDFGVLLRTFDELYDERTRREGLLTYVDVTYIVWQYLDDQPDSTWARSLGQRFQHLLIDEFQDTSYAQCQILDCLLDEADRQSQFLAIGDLKQSIYEWRSAEPNLFADLIAYARTNEDEDADGDTPEPPVDASRIVNRPLRSSFRSHPQLVQAANHIFDHVFADPGRGDVGTFDVNFVPLTAERSATEPDEPHLHLINTGDRQSTDPWIAHEIPRVAQTIKGLFEHEAVHVDRAPFDEDTASLESPNPGDVVLLFRRSRFMADYADALDEYGVDNAVVVTADLFVQPEVSVLIDVLDWFANPHSKPSLVRILRSPITALSEAALRYLASENWYLSQALEDWPADLPDADHDRLQALVDLRDDLRWDREGPKATLLEKVVRHAAFDAVVLADTDALQRYGNVWLLIEAVTQWEEDELLAYREFVDRLKRYRELAEDGESGYEVARIADTETDDTVTLMTVHSAKGLEFPIVVLPDLIARSDYPKVNEQRLVTNRLHGMALHPRQGPADPPDDADIPGPGSDSRWVADQGTGPIWISDTRDGTGEFQYPNPLNDHSRETQAEFWRLLYVAFTRAADHVFLPVGTEDPWRGQWTTWMAAFRDVLDIDTLDDGPVIDRQLHWTDPETGAQSTTIPVGVDDIDPGSQEPSTPIDIDGLGDSVAEPLAVEDPREQSFVPRVVNPSSLHDLLACPLRFQYRQLQGVSQYRADFPPGSDPPDDMPPHQWGDIVHEGLNRLHQGGPEWSRFLAEQDDTTRAALETEVQAQYEATATWQQFDDHADIVQPEFDIAGQFEQGAVSLYIRGQIDLLYRAEGNWYIVDFKTGRIADDGSYLYDNYWWQLATYAWLLRAAYDIDVAEARLVYVHPDAHETTVDLDLERFEERLATVPGDLADLTTGGLPATPAPDPDSYDTEEGPPDESRCGTCPFSNSASGLCDFG